MKILLGNILICILRHMKSNVFSSVLVFLFFIHISYNINFVSTFPMLCSRCSHNFQFIDVKRDSYASPFLTYASSVQDTLGLSLPVSVRNYVHWHKSKLKCLRQYSCDPPSILVWQCPTGKYKSCGGIGDRFRGIQFTFLLAIITEKLLLVDWPDIPYPIRDALKPYIIDWRIPKGILELNWPKLAHRRSPNLEWIKCPSHYKCINKITASGINPLSHNFTKRTLNIETDNIPLYLKKFRNIIINARADENSTENLSKNVLSMQKFVDLRVKNYPLLNLSRILLQSLFEPSEYVERSLRNIIHLEDMKTGYIAVHARTGYDFSEMVSHRFSGLHESRKDVAIQVVNCIQDVRQRSNESIFLAADSTIFKEEFMAEADLKGLSVHTSSLPGLHVDIGRTPRGLNSKDKWHAFINVFVDFFGISRARYIISNGSGFARMAYHIGNASEFIERKMNSSQERKDCKIK